MHRITYQNYINKRAIHQQKQKNLKPLENYFTIFTVSCMFCTYDYAYYISKCTRLEMVFVELGKFIHIYDHEFISKNSRV